VSLHPALLAEMLEEEVAVARLKLGNRISKLEVVGTDVFCHLTGTNVGDTIIRLDGQDYDAEPFKVAVVDETGQIAEQRGWPGNLFGGAHPGLNRPFVCIQGTFEYHCHTSHLNERWDTYRATLRLPHLLEHLVRRAGR
jgi:hypothetical protein